MDIVLRYLSKYYAALGIENDKIKVDFQKFLNNFC